MQTRHILGTVALALGLAFGPASAPVRQAAKSGGRVVYAVADLEAWVDGCARQSTSESAAGHAAGTAR